jgi:5'-AMP-activated protein kinase regulatory beta subunit
MVPIAKPDEMGLRGYQQAQALYQQPDLYSEPERGVPTMILWNHGGSSVSVLGSWDNWSKRQALQRSGRDFTLIKVLPSGVYQFKFCVDGQWTYSPDLPAVSDDTNNVNNILDVQVSFHCQCLWNKATTLGLISALGIEKEKMRCISCAVCLYPL